MRRVWLAKQQKREFRKSAMNPFKAISAIPVLLQRLSRVSFASSCSVSNDGKKIQLLSDGEPERRYHGVWLRHNCRCPVCLPPSSQQNVVHHRNLMRLKITDASMEGDNVLVKWSSDAGPHSCSFDINWLKQHDYTTPQVHHNRIQDQKPLVAESLPLSDYEEVMGSPEGYYEWMKQINYYGMTLLKNVPVRDQEMVKVTSKISEPQPHAFNSVFNVKASEGDMSNLDISYTNEELLLHMDQGFLENLLGVESLFFLKFDDCVEGGESIIVDMYPVLEDMRQKHPKQFNTLTKVPCVSFKRQDQNDEFQHLSVSSSDFKYAEPHITLDNIGEISSISWSPQWHHPLESNEKETEEYYEAYVLLAEMFETSPFKFTYRMKEGEAIVINNRRILHSRKSFKLNGGTRHLQGHYVGCDFFMSKFRSLSRQLNKTDPIKRMFNGSYSV